MDKKERKDKKDNDIEAVLRKKEMLVVYKVIKYKEMEIIEGMILYEEMIN